MCLKHINNSLVMFKGLLPGTAVTAMTRALGPTCATRALSAKPTSASDSPMATLRRRTGYAYSLCRKALELHGQDLTQAERWLRAEAAKQGWERAQRVAQRPVAEGLVAVYRGPAHTGAGGLAAMLELNCETDFVARNEVFGGLARALTRQLSDFGHTGAAQHRDPGALVSRMRFSEDQLAQLAPGLVVEAIGKLGENIRVSKACLVSTGSPPGGDAEGIHLVGYTHAVGGKTQTTGADGDEDPVLLGKYGTIVALKAGQSVTESGEYITKTSDEIQEIGKQLAQHIIGLKPKTIEPVGGMKPTTTSDEHREGQEDRDEVLVGDPESTALLEQQFVFDEDLTVAQYLNETGIQVVDFVRFECGVTE